MVSVDVENHLEKVGLRTDGELTTIGKKNCTVPSRACT